MKATLITTTLAVTFVCASWITPVSTPANVREQDAVSKTTPTPPSFAFYRVHKQGQNSVSNTWGLANNSGVTGFVLQKTYEDPYDEYSVWENTCSMPCGNQRSFKHIDANCSPGLISYRVVVMNGETVVGVSVIETVQIVQH